MKLRVGCKRKMHRDRPFRYPRALPSLDSASFSRDSEEDNGCGCSRMLYGNWKSSFPDHGIRNVVRCSADFFSKFDVSWHNSRRELFLIGLDRFGTLEKTEMEEWKIGIRRWKIRRILALSSWDFRFDNFILGIKYICVIIKTDDNTLNTLSS